MTIFGSTHSARIDHDRDFMPSGIRIAALTDVIYLSACWLSVTLENCLCICASRRSETVSQDLLFSWSFEGIHVLAIQFCGAMSVQPHRIVSLQ